MGQVGHALSVLAALGFIACVGDQVHTNVDHSRDPSDPASGSSSSGSGDGTSSGSSGDNSSGNAMTSTSSSGAMTSSSSGSVVPAGKVIALSASWKNTCAVTDTRVLFCWGAGATGEIGIAGSSRDEATPRRVPLANVTSVSVGYAYVCAIDANKALYCWGYDYNGQLGLGDNDNRDAPTRVGTANDWEQVVTGEHHTCARNSASQVYCWGGGEYGQLGVGTSNRDFQKNTPTLVADVSSVELAAGRSHTCSRNAAGDLWCWGRGDYYQSGTGGNPMATDTPHRVPAVSGVTRIAAGQSHTCVRTSARDVWCWGSTEFGEGATGVIGENKFLQVPTKVTAFAGAEDVFAGGNQTCARTSSNALACVGRNDLGQLGLGDITPHAAPGTTLPVIAGAAVGLYHGCGFTSAGEVSCWGEGENGKLGNGSVLPSNTPQKVVF